MALALALALIAAATALFAYTRVNKELVRKDSRCDAAWDVLNEQLERRNALVPLLIDEAPSYSDEQAEAISYLARMQAAVSGATTPESKMSASAELTSVLNSIIPSLEISTQRKDEVEDIDTRIAYARADYNACVQDYNTAIGAFPGKLVAQTRFRPRQSFEAVGDTARHQLA